MAVVRSKKTGAPDQLPIRWALIIAAAGYVAATAGNLASAIVAATAVAAGLHTIIE